MTRRTLLAGMGLCGLVALPLGCGPKEGEDEASGGGPPEPPMPGKEEGMPDAAKGEGAAAPKDDAPKGDD